jgi:class 3 adenylate cyclase/YHS domain-containing protein
VTQCAILFADLAGFTALTEAHGDSDAVTAARRFFTLAEDALAPDAQLVKSIGDAVMIRCAGGASAVATALSLLRAVEAERRFPSVRVGIHEGTVVEDDGDYFGATVNIAARLAAHAPVGQVLVTETLVRHSEGYGDVRVRALGELRVKNVRTPLVVFALEHTSHRASVQVTDPVCRMLIDADDAPGRLPWGDRLWYFCSWDCAATFHGNPDEYATGQV